MRPWILLFQKPRINSDSWIQNPTFYLLFNPDSDCLESGIRAEEPKIQMSEESRILTQEHPGVYCLRNQFIRNYYRCKIRNQKLDLISESKKILNYSCNLSCTWCVAITHFLASLNNFSSSVMFVFSLILSAIMLWYRNHRMPKVNRNGFSLPRGFPNSKIFNS